MNNAALRIFSVLIALAGSLFLVSWKLNDEPDYQGPPKLRVNPTETYVNIRETAKFFATCRPKQKWQVSKNNGLTWEYISSVSPYRIFKDTLFIDTVSIEYDGYLYRIECCIRDNENREDKPGNPKYCVWSNSARLSVYLPMPIRWINFDFERTTKSIKLNWYTEDEYSRIYIERLEGNRWKSISSVPYESIGSYTYEDNDPINGYNYYRLKGIYENGNFEYSKIAVVAYNKNTKDYKYFDIYGKEQKILEENRIYFRSTPEGKREKVIIMPD
jgi:hypothetical protein